MCACVCGDGWFNLWALMRQYTTGVQPHPALNLARARGGCLNQPPNTHTHTHTPQYICSIKFGCVLLSLRRPLQVFFRRRPQHRLQRRPQRRLQRRLRLPISLGLDCGDGTSLPLRGACHDCGLGQNCESHTHTYTHTHTDTQTHHQTRLHVRRNHKRTGSRSTYSTTNTLDALLLSHSVKSRERSTRDASNINIAPRSSFREKGSLSRSKRSRTLA